MRLSLLALAAGVLMIGATPAMAQSMNAEVFHKRATALMKKGPLALFSRGEIRALMEEGQKAHAVTRDRRLAAVKAGGKPRYCPSEGQTMKSDEFMKRLGAIPQAERTRIDMTEATARVLASRFPCPA